MNASNERLLNDISSEFPEKVEEFSHYDEIQPPVKEEYLRELCGNDENLLEIFEDMLEYFYRYTKDVCAQESLIKEGIPENIDEIREKEEPRSILHDSMIDSVKIFARNLNNKGLDVSWLDNIDKKGRAGYAQFALLTTFLDIIRQNHGQ